MKKILAMASCAIIIFSCSKSKDPTPVADAGTTIAGTYAVSYIRLDSAGIALYEYNLPVTQGPTTLSGQVVARKDSASVVFLSEIIKVTGQTDQQTVIGQVKLKSNGSIYDMLINNIKIGTADGKMINIDDQQTDSQTSIVYRSYLKAQKI
ncbi:MULTISPECIES: hypothetical protein [Dyadobacter]|uniref:Lipocalin-like domain-containing protein n=1 Tax=Dyadobacter psychrotolerans TaxID=2541721 RepID=A0A4R5DMI0_9BACT|nr:hypothetical protein [Dyadobacter psychrotolerans]TDE13250.1 hypothetical protein E0F88_19560 [Dyadobacter psychrotolerans]